MIWLSLKAIESPTEKGKSSNPPSWRHPLSQLEIWKIQRPTQCDNPQQLSQELASLPKEHIWFLDIQLQEDQWFVICENRTTSILYQRWQKGSPLDLKAALSNERFTIFNIHDSQDIAATSFLNLLKDYESSSKIAVISPSRAPVEKIREKRPQWFFGSDRASWTKVLVFNSLGLKGLVEPWADFYIITLKDQENINGLSNFLLKKGKVLIKEISSEDQVLGEPYRGLLPVTSPVAPKRKSP